MSNRVGIYNRCSTEEEAQMNALEIQAIESREIARKKGWVITVQYIESESGTTTKNRREYQKLLEDIEQDVFDIIMIKSIDRLMRSTKDWYLFIDKVVSHNKKLFIYMDNKFYEPDDALITGIKAILAEDFSRELSKKIKHAHRRRQDTQSGLNITVPLFGWNKIGKNEYVIHEEEAKYYRLAFAMAYEGHGFHSIAKYMASRGVRSKVSAKEISSVQWRKMIYSPRAHGTVVLHTREYDFAAKKYIAVPEKDWIYVENALPPLVSKEYQDEVIRRLQDRSRVCDFKKDKNSRQNTGKIPLSGKIICGSCGAVYYRIAYHKGKQGEKTAWKCHRRIAYGAKQCSNGNIMENTIMKVIEDACQSYWEDTQKKEYLQEETLRFFRCACSVETSKRELKSLEKELQGQNAKKKILLEKLTDQVIDDRDFQMMNQELSKRIDVLMLKIRQINQAAAGKAEMEDRVFEIRKTLAEEKIFQKAQAKVMLDWIQKIIIYPDKYMRIEFEAGDVSLSEMAAEIFPAGEWVENQYVVQVFYG